MQLFRQRKIALLMVLLVIMSASSAFGMTFTDMPTEGHWSRVALEQAVKNGLLSGYDGKITPNAPLSRAQMATIMNRVFGANIAASLDKFTDVPKGAWYYNEMAKSVHLGIFRGTGDKLEPLANITREQVCAVLAGAFNLPAGNANTLKAFSDGHLVSTWANDYVVSMVTAGYLNGDNGRLKPQATITRAELANIMNKMVQTYLSKAGVYEGTYEGNVVINAPGVTFKEATIKGNLYIGDGVKAEEVSLQGLTVLGNIVIKGSVLITELEVIEEDIALSGNLTPPSTGGGTVTPPSGGGVVTSPADDTVLKLTAVNEKMTTRVVPKLTTSEQVDAANLIMASIGKYIVDSSYDISGDVAAAKSLGLKMTTEEYTAFKNTITANIPLSELVALNTYFKVIEY